MKNFERQQKLDRQKQDHAAKMAELDEEIRQLKEQAMEAQLSKDMKNALEQKQHDLENAKIHAAQQSRMPANAESSPSRAKSSLPQRHRPSVSPPSSVAPVECSPESYLQDKPVLSPAEKEWVRQKEQDNASNDAIDSLMAMTGLAQVKDQFLRIKAKVDTVVRQNTTLNKERFGIVLLGNPGTGKSLQK
jgi:DNA replication protein DnaC